MELRILPRNVADMIAAGEVVQRPSSVVKELMENALDAGATEVTVVITDSGRTLIQVIDNGCGMTPDEAVLCFERHATSKLASPEDLHNILTFGFRGEALSSIAAVAEVTLRTRKADEPVGVEVVMDGGEHRSTKEVSAPAGSNFAVRNLFYNIPARRKFLKSDSVELRHIIEEFQRVALTRPDVDFTLLHNGREVHVLKKAKSLKFRIQDLLGASVVGDIMDISAQTTIASISGFVGKPESARKTPGNQFFFVNGRFFRSAYLHKAVLKAYEGFIPEGLIPSYFIYLEVDPSTIDVNIHPTKTEIKFEDEPMIFQTLLAAVREAAGRSPVAASLDFDNPEAREMPVVGPSFQEYRPSSTPTMGVDPDYNPFEQDYPRHEYRPSQTVEHTQNYGALFEDRELPSARLIVVKGRFILASSASGIMAVHVRRAQERVMYDRFLKYFASGSHISQSALFPVTVEVGPAARTLFEDNSKMLAELGFDIDLSIPGSVVVNAVPEGYSTEPGKVETMVQDLQLVLQDPGNSLPGVMEQNMAQKFALLGASGSSGTISLAQAQQLMNALMLSSNPEFTPGGRRIISNISLDELENRF